MFQPLNATFFHLRSNMLDGKTKHQIGRELSVLQEDNDVNVASMPSAGKLNGKLARRSTTPG